MATERVSRNSLDDSDELYMTVDGLDDFLAHYGIKGMRWGIRRERGPDGTVGGGGKAPKGDGKAKKAVKATGHAVATTSKVTGRAVATTGRAAGTAAKKVATARRDRRDRKELRRRVESLRPAHQTKTPNATERLRKLNDQQLRDVLNRLEMEKKYKDLTALPKKERSIAAKIVANSLQSAAQTQLTSAMNQTIGKSLESMTKGAFVYTPPKKKK